MCKISLFLCHSRKPCNYICRFSFPEALCKAIAHLWNPWLRPRAQNKYECSVHPKVLGTRRCDSKSSSLILMSLGFAVVAIMMSNGVFRQQGEWRALGGTSAWPVADVMAAPHCSFKSRLTRSAQGLLIS